MKAIAGSTFFLAAPLVLAAVLLRIDPGCRRIRPRSILLYLVIMSAVIWGALELVAYIASARVRPVEVAVVLWFTIGWRLAWAIWTRTVGQWGESRVRWARLRRRQGFAVPRLVGLIPLGRATVTALVFFTVFLSVVVTHRCKLGDGQDPMTIFAAPFESIRIPTADGLTLAGWFVPQDGAERSIIICHGAGANKGNFIWFLGPLLDRGYNIVFFDFRAHGGSDGRTTTYGIREREDVLAVVNWLKNERPHAARRIVGLGSSQGSMALALAAAAEPRIDAIVLDSPFVSPRELVMHRAGRVPLFGRLVADLLLAEVSLQTACNFFAASAEEAVAALGERPVMVIHGSGDFIMPASHSQRLYDAARGPREIWFGPGPHSNIVTTDPAEYRQRVFAFLDQHLGPAARARLEKATKLRK